VIVATETEKKEEDKNWLTSIPDRLAYAWQAPEQRFEWVHLTRRRFFRNLCNIPGELVGWSITTKERGNKPLFPDLSGKTSYNTPGQVIDSSLFTGMLFKQALDIGAKFGLSAFVKTAVTGYNRNEEYKTLLSTSSKLRQLAAYVVQSDRELDGWAEDLAVRDESPLMRLSRHSDQAGQIMMEFCQGSLLPTDKNLTRLQTQMEAIAQLCDQKAGVISTQPSSDEKAHHPALSVVEQHLPETASHLTYAGRKRPSDHIREVLTLDKITNTKQAVIYLATLSGLVADGAVEISSEIFTPKDENYFSAKEAHVVATALKEFGIKHSAQVPSSQDIIQLANTIKTSLRITDKKMEPLLAYADVHFAEIDRNLKQIKVTTDVPVVPLSHVSTSLTKTGRKLTSSYYDPKKIGLDYVVREETKHEMFKLYSRSLPTYLYQAPINLIERLILPNAKGKWEFNKRIVGSELKAASWMALYNPAAESFGGVSTYETTRLVLHRAVESGKRLDAFMAAAVQTAQTVDPEFAGRLGALTGNQAYQTLINEHRDILAKPANKRTYEDYTALGQLMRSIALHAKTAQKECRTLLTGSEDSIHLNTHITNIFSQGAKTTSDALLVLTLARFLEHAAEGQILSYEYVDPQGVVLDKDKLKQVAASVLSAAHNSGFAIAGEMLTENGQTLRIGEVEKIAPGTLVRKNDNGTFQRITQQEFVGFANVIVQAMSNDKGAAIQTFMTAAKGRISETAMRDVERTLLEQFQPQQDRIVEGNTIPISAVDPLTPALKKHPEHKVSWRETMNYVMRPEALHEMHQLRDRYMSVALFGFPVKIATNILRGDFNKISTAFGKWSLASTTFAAVANTLAPSYGAVALKEAVSVGNITLKHDCEAATTHLQNAINRLGHVSPEMKERLIASLGINPLLANKETIDQLALAGDADSALNQAATVFIDHTATALAGDPHSIFPSKIKNPTEIFAFIMKLPQGNPAYGALKLAALETLIAHEQKYIDVLRYEGTSARLLDNKQLKQIVSHIEDRFYTEGNKLKTASAEYITAMADELASMALPIAEAITTAKITEHQPNSERVKKDIAASIAKGLN
jgi:hypothetical protein